MIKGVQENSAVLRQGEALLGRLGDGHYLQVVRPVFDSALGTHFRHNLDHYACFLAGLDSGLIDYAARSRDLQVERCRQSALQESRRVREALEALQTTRSDLHLLADGEGGRVRAPTSTERELEFLLSHTIHHYAIIAVICRLQGVTMSCSFGVAPSTLRYRARHAARDQVACTG